MMPVVVHMLGCLELFEQPAEYLKFCEDNVIPCLAALAVAIGTDLQWKPLNHNVLMFLRDGRKSVQLAALKALKQIFTDVSHLSIFPCANCFLTSRRNHVDVIF